MLTVRSLLAICRPSGCTVASGVVGIGVVVVVGVRNISQMRTSKCTCLIFGVSIGYKRTKGIFDRSKFNVTRDISPTISGWLLVETVAKSQTTTQAPAESIHRPHSVAHYLWSTSLGGHLTNHQRQWSNAFLKRARARKFGSTEALYNIENLLEKADVILFGQMQNPVHCLYPILPDNNLTIVSLE